MLRFILTVTVLVHFSMVQAQVATLTNAILYRNDSNLVKAKEEIDKACVNEKTISMPKTWFYKGIIYKEIYSSPKPEIAALDPNALDKSFEAFNKVTTLENPPAEFTKKSNEALLDIWVISMNNGVSFYQTQSYTKALTEFQRAQAIKPTDTTAYIYAMYSANELGSNELVNKYVTKLAQLNYINDAVYYVQINSLMEKNLLDSALLLSNKAILKYPDDMQLKTQQTQLFVRTKQHEAALKNLTEFLKTSPNNVQLLMNIGSQYDELNDIDNAKATYGKVLALDSNNFVANYNMAVYSMNDADTIAQKINKHDSGQRAINKNYIPNKTTDPLRIQLKNQLVICKKYYTKARAVARNEMDKKNIDVIMTNINSFQEQYL
jgi:Flp pilus assembly protein TadD